MMLGIKINTNVCEISVDVKVTVKLLMFLLVEMESRPPNSFNFQSME